MAGVALNCGAPQFHVIVLAILREEVGDVLILLVRGGRGQVIAVLRP